MRDDHRVTGTLFGIGLGPGDPELLTIKARNALLKADLILVPKGRRVAESAAAKILESAIGQTLTLRELEFPMEKDRREERWAAAARETAGELDKGLDVAYVTLGDIGFYSTFTYLCRALDTIRPYPIVRIPGVSSVQAAAARLGTELAIGDESVGILPMPDDPSLLDRALAVHRNVVVMKIGSKLANLRDYLKDRELEDRTGFVGRLGLGGEVCAESMSSLPVDADGSLSLAIIKGQEGAR